MIFSHEVEYSCTYLLEHDAFFTGVIYGEHMIQFYRSMIMKQIIHFIILCLAYQAILIYGEWVHRKFQGKEVCDCRIMVEGRKGHIFRDQ